MSDNTQIDTPIGTLDKLPSLHNYNMQIQLGKGYLVQPKWAALKQ